MAERRKAAIVLKGDVLFPDSVIPILVGRKASLAALSHLNLPEETALFLIQEDPHEENPSPDSVIEVGVTGRIVQTFRNPDSTINLLVHAMERVKVSKVAMEDGGYISAVYRKFPLKSVDPDEERTLLKVLKEYFLEYVNLSTSLPEGLSEAVLTQKGLSFVGMIASNLPVPYETKCSLLLSNDRLEFLRSVSQTLASEVRLLKTKQEIEERVRGDIFNSQKQMFLSQVRAEIQKELEGDADDFGELERAVEESTMPDAAKEKARQELSKLQRTPTASPEHAVGRNYLDWLLGVPWEETTKDRLDIRRSARILDADHYGMKDVKKRLLEYISVLKIKGEIRGQVLCFVGPPGTGKTSLAKSVARALGRNFVRVSLGGVHDEAEIRGHRRTYVGAMPGRVVQQMKRAGSVNPVFLMDEIDKVGRDFRGDPYSALMEVLDPEINSQFNDHYLELDYDLSRVLFITTANSTDAIPRALLDRMDVINIRGYTQEEKVQIARRHLLPRQLEQAGLTRKRVSFRVVALRKLVRQYTRETGVRELERAIARVVRFAARRVVEGEERVVVDPAFVEEPMGAPRYREHSPESRLPVGVFHGLAVNETGGDILRVEADISKGSGKLELTGKLGEVIKESVKTGYTYIKTHGARYGLPDELGSKVDLHLHIPEGAIPKDGPSAGLALSAAILSSLSGRRLPSSVAASGEVTLTGRVFPVGGIMEKLLAAKRNGMKRVFLPVENRRDVKEASRETDGEIEKGVELVYVDGLSQFLDELFGRVGTAGKSQAAYRWSRPA